MSTIAFGGSSAGTNGEVFMPNSGSPSYSRLPGHPVVVLLTSNGTDIYPMPGEIPGWGYAAWSDDSQYVIDAINTGYAEIIRVSDWSIVKIIALGATVNHVPMVHPGGYVYVLASEKIVVLDQSNWSVVKTITVASGQPNSWMFSPDYAYLYFVAGNLHTTMYKVDLATDAVTSCGLSHWGFIYSDRTNSVITPDGAYIYSGWWDTNTASLVDVIDTATMTLETSYIPISVGVSHGLTGNSLAITTDGAYVYWGPSYSALGEDEAVVIDTATNTTSTVTLSTVTGTQYSGLVLTVSDDEVWVSTGGYPASTVTIDIIRPSDQANIGSFTLPAQYISWWILSPDGTQVLAYTGYAGMIIDPATHTRLDTTFDQPYSDNFPTWSPDGQYMTALSTAYERTWIYSLPDYTLVDASGMTRLYQYSASGLTVSAWWKVTGWEVSVYFAAPGANMIVYDGILVLNGSTYIPESTNYAGQYNASSQTVTAPALGTFPATGGIDLFFGGAKYTTYGTNRWTPPTGYTEPAGADQIDWYSDSNAGVTGSSGYSSVLSNVTTVGSIAATTIAPAAVNVGFHILIESARFRMPVNAWLLKWSDWSSTWSNLVVAGGQDDFTLDALIDKIITPTGFTLDALLLKTVAPTGFSVNAWLVKTITPTGFKLDAVLRKTIAPTGFKLDAWVAGSGYGAFGADAILRKTLAGSFTLDAVRLAPSGTKTLTLDAVLFRTVEPTGFHLDAEISGASQTRTGSFLLDAIARETIPGSFPLDAWMQTTGGGSFTLDALLMRTWTFGTGEAWTDDFSRTVPQWDGFGNAWVNQGTDGSAVDGAHGYIRDDYWWDQFTNATIPSPKNVGIWIDFRTPEVMPDMEFNLYAEAGHVSFNVNPADWYMTSPFTVEVGLYGSWPIQATTILEVDELTWYTVHAWALNGRQFLALWKAGEEEPSEESLSVDGTPTPTPFLLDLEGTFEGEYFYIDNLRVAPTYDFPGFTLDAELFFLGGSFPLDAVIRGTVRNKFNLYALIARNAFTLDAELAPGGAFTLDALVVGPRAGSFRLDAWIFNGTTWTFGWHADAIIKRTATGSFTANAILERVITTVESSFLAEAVCLDVSSGILTLDAHIIDRHKAGSFTVNADIRGQDEKRGTLTLDAMMKIVAASKFNLDATISQATPFRLDAWLAGAITLDAEIVSGVQIKAFMLDALIRWRGFTLDALLQPGGLFTLNATLRSVGGSWTPTGHFHLDAVIRKPSMVPPVPIWLNAWIVTTPGQTFTLDAWIGGGFQIDAWIEGNGGNLYGGAFAVDAYIKGNVTIVWPEDGGSPVDPEGNPWPDWFRASRKYRIKITVGGTDITGDVIWSRTSFTQNAKTNPGTFEITLKGTSAFDGGEEVLVEIDDFRTFGGYVLSVERSYVFDADTDPQTILRGADYNILFDKLVVYNKASASGSSGGYKHWKSFKKGTYDDTIIKKVMSSYVDLPAGLDYTTYVDRVGVAAVEVPFSMPTPGTPLRQVMQSLSQVTTSVWWIDPYLHVHNHSRSTISAPYPITDGYGGITGRAMSVSTDISQMVNEDIVWGTLARTVEGEVVAYHKTDDESIAAHGRWQFGEFRSDLHHTAYIDRRSDSILERYKDPIYRAKIVVFEPGYQAGQGVEVISTKHDISKVLVIRSMALQMAVVKERDGDTYYGVPRYELSIGLDPEDPWDIYDYLPWPDDHDVPWHSPWTRCQDCNDVVCDCSTIETFDRLVPMGWGVSEIDDIPWLNTYPQNFFTTPDGGGQFKGATQFQEASMPTLGGSYPFEVLAEVSIPAGGAGYVTSLAVEGYPIFYLDFSREAGGTLELYAFAYDPYIIDQTVTGLVPGFDEDTPVKVRLRIESGLMLARVWLKGTTEPSEWTAEIDFPASWISGIKPERLVLRFGNLGVPITYHRLQFTDGYVCGGHWTGRELKTGHMTYKSYANHSKEGQWGILEEDWVEGNGIELTVQMSRYWPGHFGEPYYWLKVWRDDGGGATGTSLWQRSSWDIDTGVQEGGYERKSWVFVPDGAIRARCTVGDPYESALFDDNVSNPPTRYAVDLWPVPGDALAATIGVYYPLGLLDGDYWDIGHNIIGDTYPFMMVPSGSWFSVPPGGVWVAHDNASHANFATDMPPTGRWYQGSGLNWPGYWFAWVAQDGPRGPDTGWIAVTPGDPDPYVLDYEYYEDGEWVTPAAGDCADIEGEVFGAVTEGWGCETIKVENGIFYTTGKVTRNTLTVYDADSGEFLHPTSDWLDNDHDGKDFTMLHAGTERVIACYRNHVENVESKYSTPRVTTASRMRVMPV